MSILEITPEQEATLTRSKTKHVKEVATQTVDSQTGEMIDTTITKTSVTGSEPDYIKVYYRTVLAFGGITDIPVSFLMAISSFITWTNDAEPMYFKSDKITRDHICEVCNIHDQMYKRYISRCVKNGLLIPKNGYRGVYDVNPFFVARGRWESISQLRATFDFIGGKWQKHVEILDDQSDSL